MSPHGIGAGGRQFLRQVDGGGTEEGRIDPVVDERRTEGNRAAAVARRGGQRGEVAGQHRGRWHPAGQVGRDLPEIRALVAAEKEHPVAHDRTAERAAVLIALQAVILSRAVGQYFGKPAGRVEVAVPDEFERIPVERIGAGLGHRADRGARVHAVLRAQAAGRDAELLQRVRKWQRQVQVVLRIVVRGAVEQVRHAE